ncbi:hypothetical protein RvY_08915-1 [Ramazzottius varieornatus]|uniref:Insulin-like domain-containing protein n=1 Tax=Ramazzottius varieornatus TaxID=947166 RepID=A0A1D1VA25_RAMVA|nr:hypothetical protein RvY_08915-1 [Ramazzottius varieornatus]
MDRRHRENVLIVCIVLMMASFCSGARVCDRDTVRDVWQKCGHYLSKRSIQDPASSFVGRWNGLRAIQRPMMPSVAPQLEQADVIEYDYEELEREEVPISKPERLTVERKKQDQQESEAQAEQGSRSRRPRNLRMRLRGSTSAVARNCEAVLQQMHQLCAKK